MKLVSDWRKAWKWHSTQIMAVIAALPFVWSALPSDVKSMIPQGYEPYIVAVMAFCGIVLRLRAQDD